jgi:shikimate kinase
MNIFIIGTFGVGKSTVGQTLAKLLKKQFYDTDRLLEERLGVDVSWILDVEGEEQFFKRETMLLQELVHQPNIVLSTGGTTILSPENRKLLTDHGIIIALSTNFKQQLYRTQYNKYKRPFLRGNTKETEKRLKEFRERFEAISPKIAAKTFSTDRKNVQTVVKEIQSYLETRD